MIKIIICRYKKIFFLFIALVFHAYLLPYNIAYLEGLFSVGVKDILFFDQEREECYGDRLSQRMLLLQLWYPAKKSDSREKMSYEAMGHNVFEQHLQEISKITLQKNDIIQNISIQKIRTRLKINAVKNAEPLDGHHAFPLLIFSHGYTMSVGNYAGLCMSLASQGYCVLAVNHTGVAGSSFLLNGTHLMCKAPPNLETFFCCEQDIRAVIRALYQKNLLPPELQKNTDVAKLGFIGHSMGGALATRLTASCKEIVMGINLDGPLFGRALYSSFKKPFLFMLAGDFYEGFSKRSEIFELMGITQQEFNEAIPSLCKELGDYGHHILFEDAAHNTFSDFPTYCRYWEELYELQEPERIFWRKQLKTGDTLSQSLQQSFFKVVLDFCNAHLKKKKSFVVDDFSSSYCFEKSKY